ncbi:MAG: BON domain-containing protein [Pseudomonadota bacterium]
MKNVWLPTVVALSLFTIVGCSQESADSKTEDAMESAGQTADEMGEAAEAQMNEAGEYLSDSAITAKVKTALFDNGGLNSSNISVETRGRVVYLSGTVSSDADAETAGQLAEGVDDVEDVENDIVVSDNY